jgi:hypothetical protein
MKVNATCFVFSLCLALICNPAAFSQDQEVTEAASSTPIAYVYVQVTKGIDVYAENAAGKLTLVNGSPFKVSGQMEGITGNHLLSAGTTELHSYKIASNGAIGEQLSSIDTATYDSDNCGPTTGNQAALDHTGKYFYVQLSDEPFSNCVQSDWQTYQIGANGEFTFINNYYTDTYTPSSAPFFNSSDKYAYSFADDQSGNPIFVSYIRVSNGSLADNTTNFGEHGPKVDPSLNYSLEAFEATADAHEHLAVVMAQCEFNDSGLGCEPTGKNPQLASYTISTSTGSISSSNTQDDVPYLQVASPNGIDMSYDGKFVAIYGDSGFQVFNFNGAALPTKLSSLKLSGTQFNQAVWDKADHLFALSYKSAKLYVFSVSKAEGVVEIGEPIGVSGAYGLTGIIVVPK